MRLRRRVAKEEAGRRLDELLGTWLPEALGSPVAKSAVRRVIVAGAVRIEGRPHRRPSWLVQAGDRVEASVDPARLSRPRDADLRLTGANVLFEDEWLIAVDKPAGVSTVPTADPSRPHVVGAVQEYLRPASGAVSAYVGVHQRLDRETSGVVLFSKDPAVNPALARAFAGREVAKTYHALTTRPAAQPPPSWQNRDPIDGAAAETDFTQLELFPQAVLVEARPRTGRKHQIRIHLATAGMPILGDARYSSPRPTTPRGTAAATAAQVPPVPRLMLHASALRLRHPKTGDELSLESPHPSDFEDVLASLRTGR